MQCRTPSAPRAEEKRCRAPRTARRLSRALQIVGRVLWAAFTPPRTSRRSSANPTLDGRPAPPYSDEKRNFMRFLMNNINHPNPFGMSLFADALMAVFP